MIINRGKLYISLVCLGVIFNLISSSAYAERGMDESALSEQTDQLAKLTPIVISAVKADVQQPMETQQQNHQRLANELSGDLTQQNINNTVLTEYETQKKEETQKLNMQKTAYIPSKYKMMQYGYSAQNNNVRVETDERITIYVNRESLR